MENTKDKTLAFFFTGGVSLKNWESFRNLDREAARYNEFSKFFRNIYFFTYGDSKDLEYKIKFPQNLFIFTNKWKVPSKIYSFLLPFLYKKEIKEADILKTNQMNGSWAAVIAKKLYGKKLVIRCGFEWMRFSIFKKRSFLIMPIIFLLERFSYKNADLIILPTKEDQEFVSSKFKIAESKIKIIPNHVDINFFEPLKVKKEKNRIMAVARLEKQKNIFSLIEAMVGIPEAKLVVFGDGSLRKDLESFSKKLGVNITFKGSILQDNLPKELNKSQIFIQPSFFEGSPKSLIEAMACGLPCIGTNVPGIKDVLIHKENCYLCNTSPVSIKDAIKNLISDYNLQEKIGRNARKTIEENFSFEKICQKELELLNSLVD